MARDTMDGKLVDLIRKYSVEHPEYTISQQEDIIFRICFEEELAAFDYSRISSSEEAQLRDFAKRFWNLGALHEVVYMRSKFAQ